MMLRRVHRMAAVIAIGDDSKPLDDRLWTVSIHPAWDMIRPTRDVDIELWSGTLNRLTIEMALSLNIVTMIEPASYPDLNRGHVGFIGDIICYSGDGHVLCN